MKILLPPILDRFRQSRICEWCLSPPARGVRLEPHHWRAKGMGGGFQIDCSINLIALDALCHRRAESGEYPRKAVLKVIAGRYFAAPEAVEEAIHVLVRLPKRADTARMQREIAGLDVDVCVLVEMAWNEKMAYEVNGAP